MRKGETLFFLKKKKKQFIMVNDESNTNENDFPVPDFGAQEDLGPVVSTLNYRKKRFGDRNKDAGNTTTTSSTLEKRTVKGTTGKCTQTTGEDNKEQEDGPGPSSKDESEGKPKTSNKKGNKAERNE
jgi:hypothetical protein